MKTIIHAAAAAALACGTLAALPAAANEKLPSPAYKAKYDAKTDTFCLRTTDGPRQVGTRIPQVECKTQSQWAAEGLTVARK